MDNGCWKRRAHRAALAEKHFAMFTACITVAMKNAGNITGRSMVEPLREGLFAEMLDLDTLPLNHSAPEDTWN